MPNVKNRFNFLQMSSSALVDYSNETIVLLVGCSSLHLCLFLDFVCSCATSKFQSSNLVVSSAHVVLYRELSTGEANVFLNQSLYLSLVTVTSTLDTKPEVNGKPRGCARHPIPP